MKQGRRSGKKQPEQVTFEELDHAEVLKNQLERYKELSFEGQAQKGKEKSQSGSKPSSGSKPVSGRKPPTPRGKAVEIKDAKKPAKKTPEACKSKDKPAKDDKPPPPPPSSSPNTKTPQGNTQGSRAKASKALAHTYTSDSQRNKTATSSGEG